MCLAQRLALAPDKRLRARLRSVFAIKFLSFRVGRCMARILVKAGSLGNLFQRSLFIFSEAQIHQAGSGYRRGDDLGGEVGPP